jgi:DNA-binding NarL/FixJ family response regulator
MKGARILIADDHLLTLEGIRSVLEPNHTILAVAVDGRALVERALELKPDLVVADVTMPLLNGIDAALRIKERLPKTKFLFVTMHVNPAYLEAALQAGCSGYVLKTAAREELMAAVGAVLRDRIYVTPGLSSEPLERFAQPSMAAASLRLTPRERETLQLIAEGKTSKEIAHILQISVKTATFHRENLKKKLGFRTTSELTKHAIQLGLI